MKNLDAKTTPRAHEIRALINQILRARLEWTETTILPEEIKKTACDNSRAYSAVYAGETHVIINTNGVLRLYRISSNGVTSLIAFDSDDTHAELIGLYRYAVKNFYSWTDREIDRCGRKNFGTFVPVSDLFRYTTDHRRLANDYADEKTYQALIAGRVKTEQEILSYQQTMTNKALKMIKSIATTKQSSDTVLDIIERGVSPMDWRVTIPKNFPSAKTHLHICIRPDYQLAEDDVKETAVYYAALIVLLSI